MLRELLEEACPTQRPAFTSTVRQILFKIDEWRIQDRIEHVELVHNKPKLAGRYTPRHVELMPVDLQRFRLRRIARGRERHPAGGDAAAEKSMADRREGLLAEYRRRRQDTITSELLDVVSGYEALRSDRSQ